VSQPSINNHSAMTDANPCAPLQGVSLWTLEKHSPLYCINSFEYEFPSQSVIALCSLCWCIEETEIRAGNKFGMLGTKEAFGEMCLFAAGGKALLFHFTW